MPPEFIPLIVNADGSFKQPNNPTQATCPTWLAPLLPPDVRLAFQRSLRQWDLVAMTALFACDHHYNEVLLRPFTSTLASSRAARIKDSALRHAFLMDYVNMVIYDKLLDGPFDLPVDMPKILESNAATMQLLRTLRPCGWCYFPVNTAPCINGCNLHLCGDCHKPHHRCPACSAGPVPPPHFRRPNSAIKNIARVHPIVTSITMASANIPWEDTIPADINFGNFVTWIRGQQLHVQIIYMINLYIITHKGVHQISLPALRLRNGNNYALRQIKCDGDNCVRCTSNLGGYRFGWRGPWTCRQALREHPSAPVARACVAYCCAFGLCTTCINRTAEGDFVPQVDLSATMLPHLPLLHD